MLPRVSAFAARIHASHGAVRAVLANGNLRRVEAARAASALAVGSYGVAFTVTAYRLGGAPAVAVLALVRVIPPAVAAPFLAALGDRFQRRHVMFAADLTRATVALAAAAAVAADASRMVVFVFAALAAVAGMASAPARASLIPALARTPDELAAANLVGTTTENLAAFVGPAGAGFLLAAVGGEAAFAVAGVASATSAILVTRIDATADRERADAGARPSLGRGAFAGFRTIASIPGLRLLVGLYAAQTLLGGVISVLLVVVAFETLDLGDAGVGYISSAMAIGGLVGAAVTLPLLGGRRLAPGFAAGGAVWATSLAAMGVWPDPALALVLFALIGISDTLMDVTGTTLIQRTAPSDVLARVFGAMASILFAVFAAGTVVGPALSAALGPRGALVATALALFVPVALAWPLLRRLDAAAPPATDLFRAVPFLAPLPSPTLELLAARARTVRAAAGEQLIAQGDVGDDFFVLADGEVEITMDARPAARERAGAYFGEIALLRDVPRTATVAAVADSLLYAIERDDFLAAVTADAAAVEAADAIVGARVAESQRRAAAS